MILLLVVSNTSRDVNNSIAMKQAVGDSSLENHANVEGKAAEPEPENDASPVVSGHVQSNSVATGVATSWDLNKSHEPKQVIDSSSLENQAIVEDEAAKPEPKSDASHVVSGCARFNYFAYRDINGDINNSNDPNQVIDDSDLGIFENAQIGRAHV